MSLNACNRRLTKDGVACKPDSKVFLVRTIRMGRFTCEIIITTTLIRSEQDESSLIAYNYHVQRIFTRCEAL